MEAAAHALRFPSPFYTLQHPPSPPIPRRSLIPGLRTQQEARVLQHPPQRFDIRGGAVACSVRAGELVHPEPAGDASFISL